MKSWEWWVNKNLGCKLAAYYKQFWCSRSFKGRIPRCKSKFSNWPSFSFLEISCSCFCPQPHGCRASSENLLKSWPGWGCSIWPYVQSGQYSAKSGYFFLKSELRSKPTTNNIHPIQLKPPWKQIWSLSLPSKIKNFLWRACRNALPMKENLVRCCVITDPTCTFCTSQAEDVLHAIWCCPNVSQVWDGDHQWQTWWGSLHWSFSQLLSTVMESDCNTEVFAMIAWTLWFRRKKSWFSPPGIPFE